MFGVGLGSAAVGGAILLFAFPLALALLLAWVIWPLIFLQLVAKSPNRNRLKWWIFMPLASLAASVIGTLKAGFLLWIPMVICFHFWPPSDNTLTMADIFYLGIAAGLSALIATKWILDFDLKMHE
jgi:hypothetical protein